MALGRSHRFFRNGGSKAIKVLVVDVEVPEVSEKGVYVPLLYSVDLLIHMFSASYDVAVPMDSDVEDVSSDFRCDSAIGQVLRGDVIFLKAEHKIQELIFHLIQNPGEDVSWYWLMCIY